MNNAEFIAICAANNINSAMLAKMQSVSVRHACMQLKAERNVTPALAQMIKNIVKNSEVISAKIADRIKDDPKIIIYNSSAEMTKIEMLDITPDFYNSLMFKVGNQLAKESIEAQYITFSDFIKQDDYKITILTRLAFTLKDLTK